MHVEILTPDAHVYDGEAEIVTLPGADGSFQIMDNHAPMVSILQAGPVTVKTRTGELRFNTMGGVAEVSNNRVAVLAEGILK